MEQNPSNSGTLVRHDAHGRRVECGRLAWARGVEIAKGADDNRARVSRNIYLLMQIAHALDELPRRYVSREFLTF